MTHGKKQPATAKYVNSGEAVVEQQVNYAGGNTDSVAQSLVRHFEDYFTEFIRPQINSGYRATQGTITRIDVTAGEATAAGIWTRNTATSGVAIPASGAGTFHLVIEAIPGTGTESTRDPTTDNAIFSLIASGTIDDSIHIPLATVVLNSSSEITSFTDHSAFTTHRVDRIYSKSQNVIQLFGGTFPFASSVAEISSSGINILENLYVSGTLDVDGIFTASGASILESTLLVSGVSILESTLLVSGAVDFKSTFGVSGAFTVSGTSNQIGNATFGAGIGVTGHITVTGNVDTVDIASFKSIYDSHAANGSAHHAKYALLDDLSSQEKTSIQNINTLTITNGEWTQVANIGSNAISAQEWAYVASQDQFLDTGGFPTFSGVNTRYLRAIVDSSNDIGTSSLAWRDIYANIYRNTDTGGSYAVRVDLSNYRFRAIGSSRRLKNNIEDYEFDLTNIDDFRLVSWNDKETNAFEFGLISEEVYEVNNLFANKDSEGLIHNFNDLRMNMIMLASIKDLRERVKLLEDQLKV